MSLMTLVNVVRATIPYEWENYSRDRAWQRQGHRFTSTIGAALNRDGIASVPGYLDAARCDRIRAAIDAIVDGVEQSGSHASGAVIDVRRPHDGREDYDTGMIDIRHIDRAIPEIAEVFAAPMIVDAIAEACGRPVRCQNCNTLVNRSVVNPRAYHSDSTGIVQFKAFIYLTDVPDTSYGPYCYVKGTHRLRWDKYANFAMNWWTGRPITDMRTHDESQEVQMTAPRGTLIVSNQNGFHRGWPQQPGRSRCMILGNYVAA
jgi:hypothetical protein